MIGLVMFNGIWGFEAFHLWAQDARPPPGGDRYFWTEIISGIVSSHVVYVVPRMKTCAIQVRPKNVKCAGGPSLLTLLLYKTDDKYKHRHKMIELCYNHKL